MQSNAIDQRLVSRIKEAFKEKGVSYIVRCGIQEIFTMLVDPAGHYYCSALKSSRTFKFQGNTYSYFYHRYNATWRNERAIEVPIVWEIVRDYRGKEILEVGNVLSHYFSVEHDILDKYEKADNVINHDVVDFFFSKQYDLVVSISTLEHVGWNEEPRDPVKILHAIENLRNHLAPEGKIVVTLPIGLNSDLDRLLHDGKIEFAGLYCMKRIPGKHNAWIETDWEDVKDAEFGGFPFSRTYGLIIGIIEK
jgi:hypothetical protein